MGLSWNEKSDHKNEKLKLLLLSEYLNCGTEETF